MFEQLFGSKTRVKLMKLFLENKSQKFFVRELTRLTDSLINSVRRELNNLIELKIIKVDEIIEDRTLETGGEKKGLNAKKFYYLNMNNIFLPELNNLFAKAKLFIEKRLLEKIKKLDNLSYVSFGGIFTDDEVANTDILLIGNFDKSQAYEVMNDFEAEVGKPIRYTVLTENEYSIRREIADRFLLEILNNPKNLVILDKLERNNEQGAMSKE